MVSFGNHQSRWPDIPDVNEDVGRRKIFLEIPWRSVVVVGRIIVSCIFRPNNPLKSDKPPSPGKLALLSSPEVLIGNAVIITPAELVLNGAL